MPTRARQKEGCVTSRMVMRQAVRSSCRSVFTPQSTTHPPRSDSPGNVYDLRGPVSNNGVSRYGLGEFSRPHPQVRRITFDPGEPAADWHHCRRWRFLMGVSRRRAIAIRRGRLGARYSFQGSALERTCPRGSASLANATLRITGGACKAVRSEA